MKSLSGIDDIATGFRMTVYVDTLSFFAIRLYFFEYKIESEY